MSMDKSCISISIYLHFANKSQNREKQSYDITFTHLFVVVVLEIVLLTVHLLWADKSVNVTMMPSSHQ